MNIKDRLVRRSNEDRVEIGEIVKRAYNGRFGEVFRAYIDAKLTIELEYHKHNVKDTIPLNADRILGRCEAYNTVLLDLERMIAEGDALQQPIKEESIEEEE